MRTRFLLWMLLTDAGGDVLNRAPRLESQENCNGIGSYASQTSFGKRER